MKEAQDSRHASLARIPDIAEVFEQNILSNQLPNNAMLIHGLVLGPRDVQITESLPEELIKLLASGQLSATDVTLTFLRRAAVAQKLVSLQSCFLRG